MSHLSSTNKTLLTDLAHSYSQLPWYKRLFFPRRLGETLTQFHTEANLANAQAICEAFFNHTWFFQRWFFSLLEKFSASRLMEALRIFHRYDLVGQANYEGVLQHHDLDLVAASLEHLSRSGLLAEEGAQSYCNMVMKELEPYLAAEALILIYQNALLTGEGAKANRQMLENSLDLVGAVAILNEMNTADLLIGYNAQDNRDAAIHTQIFSHYGLSYALKFLQEITSFDEKQRRFNDLIANAAVLFGGEMGEMWTRMPQDAFLTVHFNECIRIARAHQHNPLQGQTELQRYIRHELLHEEGEGIINNTQSTHTASINESASQTATQLLNRYGDNIFGKKLDQVIKDLLHWGNARLSHATTLKEQAALRGLKRITELTYVHSDSRSGVSTRQFLALFWLAIHDKEHLIGKNLENAKEQLIQGLYEIQRGYNLNDQGIDDNQSKDIPICVTGTFNKLVEKLAGLHPEAEFKYITRETANAKFEILVREKAVLHLKRLKSQGLLTAELLEMLAKGLAPIWDAISPDIKKTFLEEFGCVYTAGSDDFVALMEAGKSIIVDEKILADLKQTLDSSPVASSLAINHSPRLFQPEPSTNQLNEEEHALSLRQ